MMIHSRPVRAEERRRRISKPQILNKPFETDASRPPQGERLTYPIFISLLLLPLCLLPQPADNRVLIDGVVTAVYGPQETTVITYSDIQRPGIDGQPRTLDGLINRILKEQDAQRYGMKSTPEAVDKQLQAVFRTNNWTEEDFNKLVQTIGWLPEEARDEFRTMTDVNQIESFKLFGQLIVPERDIQAYYSAHLEYEEASYQVARAVIPYDYTKERDEQKREIILQQVQDGVVRSAHGEPVEPSEPFWISDADIADDKAYIRSLALHTPSEPHPAPDGFEILKVEACKERRLKTLDETRSKIVEILRKPRAEELQAKYTTDLRKNAAIVHFDEELAEQKREQEKGD